MIATYPRKGTVTLMVSINVTNAKIATYPRKGTVTQCLQQTAFRPHCNLSPQGDGNASC